MHIRELSASCYQAYRRKGLQWLVLAYLQLEQQYWGNDVPTVLELRHKMYGQCYFHPAIPAKGPRLLFRQLARPDLANVLSHDVQTNFGHLAEHELIR